MSSLAESQKLDRETSALNGEVSPDPSAYAKLGEDGLWHLHLLVEGVHCGGCVNKIERALRAQEAVAEARVNLSTRRLALAWRGRKQLAGDLAKLVESQGFSVAPFEPSRLTENDQLEEKELLRCLAVAGFAAANVMLLSVSVWAGHFEGMEETTRSLLHWFSALVALPAIVYAGRPFFRSALTALRAGSTNMEVPISLAVLLASGMSLAETMRGGEHAYFDSAITLLFFLLIGRFLDRRARGRARSAAERLLALAAKAVSVIEGDGTRRLIPAEEVEPGMTVALASGERAAIDGTVLEGQSDLDNSMITGETLPQLVSPGERIFAGTLNISAPLKLLVTAVGEKTLLAEIVRLMELAEQRRARFVSLADRLSRIYAPFVHSLALLAFLGWVFLAGMDWQPALMIAVAVLIITCPCALGLAVPAVQVIASGRLMRSGIFLKSATALERMAEADYVVFDKTGTLTLGRPVLLQDSNCAKEDLELAASMALASHHPLARALAAACPDAKLRSEVKEVAGCGLLLDLEEGEVRLGSRRWCGLAEDRAQEGPELWLLKADGRAQRFAFEDPLRSDAKEIIDWLKAKGKEVELLSGDREVTVKAVAETLGLEIWSAAQTPHDKAARLEELQRAGRKPLMVGDGLNDAPALAAAYVSLSPSSAIDISQTAADAVFQGQKLAPIREVLQIAKRSEALVKQNFGLAIAYNFIAVPLAVAGFVTPLIAAVAMSSSSILVIANALRLSLGARPKGSQG